MKRILVLCCAVVMVMGLSAAAGATTSPTVVTFDDLSPGLISNGYDNIVWNGEWSVAQYSAANPAYSGPESGNYAYAPIFTADLAPEFSFGNSTPAVFQGADFSGPQLAGGATSQLVKYVLYYGTSIVYQSPTPFSVSSSPQFFASGYDGTVTDVAVETFLGSLNLQTYAGFWAMSDLTFVPNGDSSLPVPLPGSIFLLLPGLAGLAASFWLSRGTRAVPEV